MKQRRDKSKSRVTYISLKPLAKKERKRQQRLAEMGLADHEAIRAEEEGGANEAAEWEEEGEWVPRSPVPLPDNSTCKPILSRLGVTVGSASKKKSEYGLLLTCFPSVTT